MTGSGIGGCDFLERVDRMMQKKQAELQAKAVEAAGAGSGKFQPKLNKKSTDMRPRSYYEMSRGDLLRKETNRRMLKLQTEQEELANLTFTPQISRRAREV